MKRVVVSVINDLVTDQRVHKVCQTLHEMGFSVLLVGRKKKDSLELGAREYQTKRMKLLFEKGPLFYAEYNIRLFFFLLVNKTDLIVSNDLDTLLSSYVISIIKRKELIYDTHEFFTGVPELNERYIVKKIWETIESFVFPKLKNIYTVNSSLAVLYYKLYGKLPKVIRNVPCRERNVEIFKRPDFLPEKAKIIIYQGAVNKDRGVEEVVEAMKYVKTDVVLLIIGGGDLFAEIKEKVDALHLNDKIFMLGSIPFEELKKYTQLADIGVSLEKGTNINYKYCLPNKLFDYIQSEVPVLVSRLPEMESLMKSYNIGILLDFHDPKDIAQKIDEMLNDSVQYSEWKKVLKSAAEDFCWEKEKVILQEIYLPYV